jgi:hypothetical protein
MKERAKENTNGLVSGTGGAHTPLKIENAKMDILYHCEKISE